MPPDNNDSTLDFLREIDTALTSIGENPLQVIPEEARTVLLNVRRAYEKIFDTMADDDPEPLLTMINRIEAEVPGVEFQGDECIGFFVIPGVKRIDDDRTRNLVIAYIDWKNAMREELIGIEHFHVGFSSLPGEIADVWAIPGVSTGLVWSDKTNPEAGVQTHFPEHGLRVMPHGSHDGYSAIKGLTGPKLAGMPSVYFGPYWGAIAQNNPIKDSEE